MKKLLAIILSLAMVLALVACGGSSAPAATEAPKTDAPAAEAPAAEAPAASGNKFDITLGTAGTTGTYYVVGAAIANAVTKVYPNLTVVAQATNGGVENVNLILSGDMEMGFTNADAAYWSCYGGGTDYYSAYANPGDVRGVMRLYESQGHMITLAGSDIESYADLVGKKVCLGPPSSTIPAMSIAILEAYGIDVEKDIEASYYSIAEGLEKLADGVIDATFFVASAPASGLTSQAATTDLKFVDADPAILEQVCQKYPYYSPSVTKEGAYPTMNSVNTLKIYTEIICGTNVPEEAVYEFVKNALESIDTYVDAHVACQEINPETASQASAELHPGALKYYQEVGVK